MTDLPPGWAWATLDELAAPVRRAITDGPFGSNLKTQHYTEEGPRVIRLQNIGFGEFIDERAHISKAHYEILQAHSVNPGDLVVASLGEDLPRSCIIPESATPAIVKTDCIRVRLHPGVSVRYVNYALQRPDLKRAVADQIHGVGRPRLGMKGIRSLAIPIPPRAEQERIVAAIEEHLSRLDAAQASARSAQRRTSLLQRAVFSQADDPRWPERHFNDLLIDIEAGKSFETPGRPARLDEWGVIKVSAMTWGEFNDREHKAVPPNHSINRRLEVRPGDLLLSRANTSEYVGATVLVTKTRDRLLLSDKSMRLLVADRYCKQWVWYALSSPQLRHQMALMATGTSNSMRNISQQKVRSLKLHVPPLEVQTMLAERIDRELLATRRLADQVRIANQRAEALHRSILAAAFSGRLVPQDPGDEPASVMLARIKAERASARPVRARRAVL